ncbi:MAG: hypothetical protein HY721_13730 [Planctomycetes bacterium]|nr:hypothetical protein [Planctomycetota bacterium]
MARRGRLAAGVSFVLCALVLAAGAVALRGLFYELWCLHRPQCHGRGGNFRTGRGGK